MRNSSTGFGRQETLAQLQRRSTVSSVLLLLVYPLISAVATLPVPFTGALGGTVSVELFLSAACLVVVAVEVLMGKAPLGGASKLFLFGLALWLGANVVSGFLHYMSGTIGYFVFRMFMKAAFGYMVYMVLRRSGQLRNMMVAYVVGCAAAGLVSFAFWVQTGDLAALREAGFLEKGSSELEQAVDVFAGAARIGAGNIVPIYFCLALLWDERKTLLRMIWLGFLPFFAVLAVLPLRREVFVEGAVALLLILPFAPRRYWLGLFLVGACVAGAGLAVVAKSDAWRVRIEETRDQFETGSDPRMIMLRNTPYEMMREPVFGQGPASYYWAMGAYFPIVDPRQTGGIAAHNSYSRAAVETGIVGLSGMVLFTGSLCWGVWRARRQATPLGKRLHLIACLVLLKIGVLLNFGDGIADNRTWFFIGILLFIVATLDRIVRASSRTSQSPTPRCHHRLITGLGCQLDRSVGRQ